MNIKIASLNNGKAQIIGKIEAENGIIYAINRLIIQDFSRVLKVIDNGDLVGIVMTTFEKAIEIAGLTSWIEDRNEILYLTFFKIKLRGAIDSFFIHFLERIKGNKTEKMPRKARNGGKRW